MALAHDVAGQAVRGKVGLCQDEQGPTPSVACEPKCEGETGTLSRRTEPKYLSHANSVRDKAEHRGKVGRCQTHHLSSTVICMGAPLGVSEQLLRQEDS